MKGYMCLICTIEINRSLRGNKEVLGPILIDLLGFCKFRDSLEGLGPRSRRTLQQMKLLQ